MELALWKYTAHALASGLGAGLVPLVPGTLGSLLGVALHRALEPRGRVFSALALAALFLAGIFVCGQAERDSGMVDPGFIVYDEIVGMALALLFLPRTSRGRWVLSGFLLFRVLDGWKPFPIHLAEERLSPGLAIMADDALAALYTMALLALTACFLRAKSRLS